MISPVYFIGVYLYSIFMFMNSSNPLIFWIVMEVNLLLYVLMMYISEANMKVNKQEFIFLYFITQSLFSLVFLGGVYFRDSFELFSELLFCISICGKLGIFPFYFWVLMILHSLNYRIFIILMSAQKIPLFMLMFNLNFSVSTSVLFLSFIFGSMMISFCKNFMEVVFFSSMGSSFWVYFLYSESYLVYFSFFIFYSLSLMQLENIKNSVSSEASNKMILFMFLCGLPPFSLFFFKFFLCSVISVASSSMIFLSLWILSFISLVGYTKFLYSGFFSRSDLYLKKKFTFKKMSFLAIIILSSLLFLL